MGALFREPLHRGAGYAPLVVRVLAGIVMAAHGLQKLTEFEPANFGGQALAGLGVPLPVFMGYVVTFVELIAAILLTIDLVVAILLAKVNVGLLSPSGGGVGAELDLALIAGFLVILLAGPGRLSLD